MGIDLEIRLFLLNILAFFRVKRVHSDRICHFQAQSSQLNLLAKSETFDCIALTVMPLASPLWGDIWV